MGILTKKMLKQIKILGVSQTYFSDKTITESKCRNTSLPESGEFKNHRV